MPPFVYPETNHVTSFWSRGIEVSPSEARQQAGRCGAHRSDTALGASAGIIKAGLVGRDAVGLVSHIGGGPSPSQLAVCIADVSRANRWEKAHVAQDRKPTPNSIPKASPSIYVSTPLQPVAQNEIYCNIASRCCWEANSCEPM